MNLLHLLHKRDLLASELKKLDEEIALESRNYSSRRGYLVPLRSEDLLRELSSDERRTD